MSQYLQIGCIAHRADAKSNRYEHLRQLDSLPVRYSLKNSLKAPIRIPISHEDFGSGRIPIVNFIQRPTILR